MSNWLDLSNNANCFESMYVKGFVDISGGSLQLRNSDNHLLVGGDASFNGGVYLGGTKLVTTDVVESITFTGGPSYQIGQDIDGEASDDQSGYSVSINSDGTIVAIGANKNDGTTTEDAGHVRVYQYNGTVWNQLGQDIDGEAAGDESGYSVSINNDGTIVAIGAINNDGNGSNYGHVRIYQYNGTVWNQLGQDIDGINSFGQYVSLNGDGTMVASSSLTGFIKGYVSVYQYNGSVWNQIGQNIIGDANYDAAYAVSLNDNGTILAASWYNYDGTVDGSDIGKASIYKYDGSNWVLLGQNITGEIASGRFGWSLTLSSDGTVVAIGTIKGSVSIYKYDGTVWNKIGQDIDRGGTTGEKSNFLSLSSDGTIVAVGAYINDGTGASDCGHTRIYQYDSGNNLWNQLGQDIDGEAANDWSGYSVSISSDGTRVAIGARDSHGTGISDMGHVRVYELAHTKNYVQFSKQIPLQIGTESQRIGYAADISGIVDISGALFTQGDVSMNGNLYVSGDATIGGALTFGSASISASNVAFSSDISMNDRLFVNVSDVNYNGISGYLTTKTLSGGPSYQIGQDIDGEATNDNSGHSVSMNSDGTIVAIGAYDNDGNGSSSGHVRIYQYNGTVWNKLGQDIDGEASGDYSGWSVSLSDNGTIVAIGSRNNAGTGVNYMGNTRIYQYNGTVWNKIGQDIDGEAKYDLSGISVSLNGDGTIVAIGANDNDGNESASGHVRIYQYNGTVWNQLGQDIDGEDKFDFSGQTVSLSSDGTIVAIGAVYNDGTQTNSGAGHVRVYQYNGTVWNKIGQDIDGEATNDNSGQFVSINGNGTVVAIGSIWNDGTSTNTSWSSGHVRVYQYNGTVWNKIGQDIDGEAQDDQSGYSVSLSSDGTIVAIGAIFNDGNGSNSGHTRIYQYNGTVWNKLGQDIDGEAQDDWSGYSVSLSSDGTRVAIGARNNDGNGSNAGHVRVYELASTTTTTPIYQKIHSDVNSSGTFSTDTDLISTMVVPSNITIVDSSNNNYGSYTVYTDKAATNFFSVGKSASHVFNIVNHDNAGVYMASGSTSLTSTSDARLKTAIEPIEDTTDKLMQLNPCTYKWKTQDEADPKKHVGFIAQEVEALFPNLVNENTYPDGSTYKGVTTTDMIPYLIKSIQGNQKFINDLKSELEELEK